MFPAVVNSGPQLAWLSSARAENVCRGCVGLRGPCAEVPAV